MQAYAWKHLFPGLYTISRGTTAHCLECNGTWKVPRLNYVIESDTCPHCEKEVKYLQFSRHMWASNHFEIVTVKEGFQVIRIFTFTREYHKFEKPWGYFQEAIQHWIDKKGRTTFMRVNTKCMSPYYDDWVHGSPLEIRMVRGYRGDYQWAISPQTTYPTKRFIPEVIRNGFDDNLYGYSYQSFFKELLSSPQFETLLKAGQYNLLKDASNSRERVKRYWNSIKICIRNNYIIPDGTVWLDHMDLLEYFNKDIHSPKYICPHNLHEEHYRYTLKKNKVIAAQQLAEREKEAAKFEKAYKKHIEKFKGKVIKKDNIVIKPIETVRQFAEISTALKHCLYTNNYFERKNSLILAAYVDDEVTESIELSLNDHKIVQSRGLLNDPTEYHDQIVDTLTNNLNLIFNH
jgi:hypothetical protein